MKLFVEESRELPLVRAQVTLPIGGGDDASELDGLAHFSSDLLARGAAGKSRTELDAAFDALGTSLGVGTNHDSSSFGFSVLHEHLDAAMALFADVLLRPDFPAKESEKLRRELAASLDELRDDDGALAQRFFPRALYGDHPYGRSVIGNSQTLERMNSELARRWHERVMVKTNLVFGFAGAISAAEASALVDGYFGHVPSHGAGEKALLSARPALAPKTGLRLLLIDKPERTQSQILIGQPAPAWSHPDFLPLSIATCAFGGTFTARLMNEVRSKRGLSYGTSARLSHARGPKALTCHVFPSLEQTAETLELVLRLYQEWADQGLRPDEADFVRGYLSSSFAFQLATPEDRLDLQLSIALCGLPADYGTRYAEKVRAVSDQQIAHAMQQHLRPRDLQICIVSTADALRPRLEQAGLKFDSIETVAFDSY